MLTPITRDRYDYAGKAQTRTPINPTGIDLHVGHVGPLAYDNADTDSPIVHHYMVLWTHAGTDRHNRLAGGRSASTYGFQLTVASGTRAGCLWAIDLVRDLMTRAE